MGSISGSTGTEMLVRGPTHVVDPLTERSQLHIQYFSLSDGTAWADPDVNHSANG